MENQLNRIEEQTEHPTKAMLTSSELSAFCAQVGMVLRAGISTNEGLSIMIEDAENHQAKEILEKLAAHVELGETFSSSLEQTGYFPKYMVDMVHIGEQSGRLDDVMDALCIYYEREESIKKNIKSAITYPLVMIAMMMLVIGVLLVKVLPIFNQVFVQLGSEMSGFFQGMLNLGNVLGRYSAVILVLVVAVFLVFYFMNKSPKGKASLTSWKATFFATKNLSARIASARFASAMSMMLSSGLDTDQSLEMVGKLVDHPAINGKIDICREMVAGGQSFSESLSQSGIFTGIYARMINVGFKTGAVDTMMQKIADQYDNEVNDQVEKMVSILEPTLVAILSIIVGMVLLSVMLPLMGIMSSIG